MSTTIRQSPARRSRSTALRLLATALLFAAAAPAAHAGVFYDASLALNISDDARVFLNMTNRHFGTPEPQAVSVLNRCPRPESDYPVVELFARLSGRRADVIVAWRQKGLPWSEVMVRLQIPADRLFAGLDRDPGPPYGNAWGHWKKGQRGRGKKEPVTFDDVTIADLARLQIASAALRVSPYTIIEERRRGVSVERFVVIRSQPSGVAAAKSNGSKPRPEKGRGHGKDKLHPAQNPR
ncbi:MAG TPA: hypothetical protein VFD06_10020 [Candidatus Polarisedimenticolia bacterium]|nr:hypothetical protein [Candidatus Polarisedimenticolia bacterium]